MNYVCLVKLQQMKSMSKLPVAPPTNFFLFLPEKDPKILPRSSSPARIQKHLVLHKSSKSIRVTAPVTVTVRLQFGYC